MSALSVLNNIDHKDLKIITQRSPEFGDGYMYVPTFPREFRSLQACYPIVFSKNNDTGEYTPLVLLGLQEGENLFVRDGVWDARYLPLCAEAKPFFIGPGQRPQPGEDQQWVIHVDTDSPKLSTQQGEPLFREQGGNGPYLERMSQVLGVIHENLGEVRPFTELLEKFQLLEPFSVETTLKNQMPFKLGGFFTINEERLAELTAEQLGQLHSRGFLFDIYMQLASISQLSNLFERKNRVL